MDQDIFINVCGTAISYYIYISNIICFFENIAIYNLRQLFERWKQMTSSDIMIDNISYSEKETISFA